MLRFMNSSEHGLNSIKEELRALRLMLMQHRYVLDLMTAMECGVCAKIGATCSTFVPGNDMDNGSLGVAVGK